MSVEKCDICGKDIDDKALLDHTDEVKAYYKKYCNLEFSNDLHVCNVCAEKEIQKILLKKVYGPFFEAFGNLVNPMGVTTDPNHVQAAIQAFTCQHRTLQSNMVEFLINLLKAYSKLDPNMYFDGRNDWVKLWAKKASEIL